MVSFASIFFVYSFVGFLLEVLFAWVTGQRGGRKCLLLLPFCPVYGVGAAAVLSLPPVVLAHPWAVLIGGGMLATLAEGAAGLFYTHGVGVRFWDYSQRPGNLGGQICPLFTLCWGVLAVVVVYGLHPLLLPLITGMPTGLLTLLFLLFSGDALVSLWLLHRTGDPRCLRWYLAFLPLS